MLNDGNTEFSSFLKQIHIQLDSEDFIKIKFEDFLEFLPNIEKTDVLDKDSISYISDYLHKELLESEPKINRGFVERHVESPIYLFKNTGPFDHTAIRYKQGLLMVRMAVIMAFADGSVSEDELLTIKEVIWDMDWLSSMEKRSLFAKANYLITPGLAIDERTATYNKISLNREILVKKVSELSQKSASFIIQVAQDVAIADGFLDKGEISLLQDIYRVLEMSVRSVQGDLTRHAAKKHLYVTSGSVKNRNEDLIPETEMGEIEDVLGDLLLDFDEF